MPKKKTVKKQEDGCLLTVGGLLAYGGFVGTIFVAILLTANHVDNPNETLLGVMQTGYGLIFMIVGPAPLILGIIFLMINKILKRFKMEF